MNFNKAALFGLDARIALSIFGALSVISGAALYSAIKDANNIKYLSTLEEFTKSIDQYFFDTGSYIPQWSSGSNLLKIGNLNSNYESISGWKGPYIGNGSSSSTVSINAFDHLYLNDNIRAYLYLRDSWTGPDSDYPDSCSGNTCSLYISLCGNHSNVNGDGASEKVLEIAEYLDTSVDNSDGAKKGKIRFRTVVDTSSDNNCLYYQHFKMTKY